MTLELLSRLIGIPSHSREEGLAASFLEEWLCAQGLQPRRCGNNLWCVKGQGPVVLLDAHIDTVKPADGWTQDPYTAWRDGDRLYGLGANDDGGSLAALVQAFLRYSPRRITLVLSLSAEEEVSGKNGFEKALEAIQAEVGPVSCGIIGEPTGMQAAVSEKGLMVLDCLSTGVSGHAARGEGVNALYQALPDLLWFRDQGMQVTQIQAGEQHNVIPDSCRFVVDVRTCGPNEATLERIRQAVRCHVTPRSTRLSGRAIDPSHPLVKAAQAVGLGTMASSTLSNQALCPFPTIKLGPGDSARSHAANEYIGLDEVQQAVDIYLKLLESYEQNLG